VSWKAKDRYQSALDRNTKNSSREEVRHTHKWEVSGVEREAVGLCSSTHLPKEDPLVRGKGDTGVLIGPGGGNVN
jgi:hypothetical protein